MSGFDRAFNLDDLKRMMARIEEDEEVLVEPVREVATIGRLLEMEVETRGWVCALKNDLEGARGLEHMRAEQARLLLGVAALTERVEELEKTVRKLGRQVGPAKQLPSYQLEPNPTVEDRLRRLEAERSGCAMDAVAYGAGEFPTDLLELGDEIARQAAGLHTGEGGAEQRRRLWDLSRAWFRKRAEVAR